MKKRTRLVAAQHVEGSTSTPDAEGLPLTNPGDRQLDDRTVPMTTISEQTIDETTQQLPDQSEEHLQSEADQFLNTLPANLRKLVKPYMALLLEVRLDVGRLPHVVLTDGSQVRLSQDPVAQSQLTNLVKEVGPFDAENRAALDGSLHRFSQILNRQGKPIGLTLAYGRPLLGHIQRRVADVVCKAVKRHGATVGILGISGAGKTTHLRRCLRTRQIPGQFGGCD
jgi:ABC-type multidrug transport system fused ATPase/permease subunit